ncbi:MAG: DUF4126 domain-containing protein [Planctomycetaceae bacterium]
MAGLAAGYGWLDPSESFAWIATTPALVAFSVATIEAVAYYVPWLDNLLDTIASPLAVIAGILLSASMLGDVSPLMQWSLAIIAGGGAAAAVQGGTVLTRLASTTTTGGTANFLLTTLETAASHAVRDPLHPLPDRPAPAHHPHVLHRPHHPATSETEVEEEPS